MITSSYGYRIPESGDKAKGTNGWFAAIEYDIQRLNDHDHDGLNSALLSLSSFAPYTGTLSAASWGSPDSSGIYTQLVTAPGGITEISDWNVRFIATAPAGMVGENLYLAWKRISGVTFEVYSNDNTVAATILYR